MFPEVAAQWVILETMETNNKDNYENLKLYAGFAV